MSHFVVDTNVAVVANLRSPQAGHACVLACVTALQEVVDSGCLVLDSGREILREYMKRLTPPGQPGIGFEFMRWVFQHQADPSRCERVTIIGHVARGYCEFPDDPTLAGFHPDDRKFVAVALASRNSPVVLNAVDSDWWNCREHLARNGVRVLFLCPEQFTKSEV